MKILTPEQMTRRAELRARYEEHEKTCDRVSPRKRNGWRVITLSETAEADRLAPFSNEERAELETLDFCANKPERVFVYPKDKDRRIVALTGFMGNILLTPVRFGTPFRSNMGDQRQSVRAIGINGCAYVGTIYGTYARLRKAKR